MQQEHFVPWHYEKGLLTMSAPWSFSCSVGTEPIVDALASVATVGSDSRIDRKFEEIQIACIRQRRYLAKHNSKNIHLFHS
jgi:hypothetical protein